MLDITSQYDILVVGKGTTPKGELKMKTIKEQIADLSTESLLNLVSKVNSYDGSLEHLEYYDWVTFEDLISGMEPSDVIRCTLYGDVMLSHDYIGFDGYANFQSLNKYDYGELLGDSIDEISQMVEDLWDVIDHGLEEEE